MSKKRNVSDYDWAMYVDASGDDGFVFDRGSSSTYTVNCFMCKTDRIPHNLNVLRAAKAVVRCDHKTEMKSSTVIKSKKRGEICDVLSTLDGVVFQFVIFKKCIDSSGITDDQKKKHFFSTLAHSFTIEMAASFHRHFGKSLCIIVDNMKEAEVLGTRKSVSESLSDIRHTILFADSKSAEHALLQISDFFAGLTNRACANHEAAITNNPSINRCLPCGITRLLCHGNPRSIQTELFYDIQRYANLFAVWSNRRRDTVMGNGIRLFPISYENKYRFFDCVLHTPPKKAK